MINNIAHHLHASPIMHVHVVTLIIALIIAAACITTWALHALFPALCMPCTMVPHGWPCGDATVFSFTIAHPSNNTP